jgi:hypothetical protein
MRAWMLAVLLSLGWIGLAAWQAGCGQEDRCSSLVRPGYDEHCCPGTSACQVGPGVYFCKNFQTDPDSCGGCWVECGPGTCVAGACVCPPAPVKLCPPDLPSYNYPPGDYIACVDTSTDSANCGDCGVHCGTDEWCVGGSCVRDDRCDAVTCRSATVCGQVIPCERCVRGACEALSPHFRDCVPSCGVAASACRLTLTCGAIGGTCKPSYDCPTCCTGP